MRPTTIEQIISNEILSRYNRCEFVEPVFFFEFDMNNTTVEVEGAINVEGYEDGDYYSSVGGFVVTSVDVDIRTVEVYNEDGDTVAVVDMSKINELVRVDIR